MIRTRRNSTFPTHIIPCIINPAQIPLSLRPRGPAHVFTICMPQREIGLADWSTGGRMDTSLFEGENNRTLNKLFICKRPGNMRA